MEGFKAHRATISNPLFLWEPLTVVVKENCEKQPPPLLKGDCQF